MDKIQGKSVCGGVVIGTIHFLKKNQVQVKRSRVEDTTAEITRFEQALEGATKQLMELYDVALAQVGEANAMIFEIHQQMLGDLDYQDSVRNIISTQEVNAEYAVAVTADNFAQMFSDMEDEYMKARAADVRDVSERLIEVLSDGGGSAELLTEPVILAADDLAPCETVQLDKSKVLAFVTRKGSSNSHTAILARSMNIPAIIGVGDAMLDGFEGKRAIVDGFTGEIVVEPDEELLAKARKRQEEEQKKQELLLTMKGVETVTRDGKKMKLYANIGAASDLSSVYQNDAGGIGLFRSEFLYLENKDYPTEEEQFAAYKYVAESMAGKQVIVRTLDIGADKKIDYFHLPEEENPALGYRAIRICLEETALFRTQLRAILRASAYGNIAIMFPMITSVWEVKECKKILEDVKKELDAAAVPYNREIQVGIMIETPAAALISDELAPLVDFFSVGTNDLTQYTEAIDRQNSRLDRFYQPAHKAVLRLIAMAAKNAHRAGIWIGICGELAANEELTEAFLGMGIDELSVSPVFVLPLRKRIRELDTRECEKKAEELLQ